VVCSGVVRYLVNQLAEREVETRRWLRLFNEWLTEAVALMLLRDLGMLKRPHTQNLN